MATVQYVFFSDESEDKQAHVIFNYDDATLYVSSVDADVTGVNALLTWRVYDPGQSPVIDNTRTLRSNPDGSTKSVNVPVPPETIEFYSFVPEGRGGAMIFDLSSSTMEITCTLATVSQ